MFAFFLVCTGAKDYQFKLYRNIPQMQYAVFACSNQILHMASWLTYDALPYILSYRSVHVLWPSTLLSNGCFDVLDVKVVLVVLELLGQLGTELEIRDWELVNSVTEPSCLTKSKLEAIGFARRKTLILVCLFRTKWFASCMWMIPCYIPRRWSTLMKLSKSWDNKRWTLKLKGKFWDSLVCILRGTSWMVQFLWLSCYSSSKCVLLLVRSFSSWSLTPS
jgi:hypothetical protein